MGARKLAVGNNPLDDGLQNGGVPARSRVQVRLTREGSAYVVVVIFVAAAAILRNINLLILLNGLMIAPLLLSWRLSRGVLLRIEARRVVMPLLFANRQETVFWELHNRRRWMPGLQISVVDRASDGAEGLRALPGSPLASVVVREVAPGSSETGSYRIRFPRRGRYWLGPAEVLTEFPFGLIRSSYAIRGQQEVLVAPAVGHLVAGWDRRLMSHAAGDEALKRRSGVLGDEFFAVRPWRSGDSLRHLHWRSTARQNRPMVRQFDRRSDRDVILVLDLWQPETASAGSDTGADPDRVELVLSFAASVVMLAAREVDGRVWVGLCGSDNELVLSKAEGAAGGVGNILERLAVVSAGPDPDLLDMLRTVADATPAGVPVCIVTTRQETAEFLALSATYADPALAELQPWLRFLSPGRPEFASLYSAAPASGRMPAAVSEGKNAG